MGRVKAAMILSILVIALFCVFTLTQAPAVVVSHQSIEDATITTAVGDVADCQPNNLLLAHVSALRLGLEASPGPRVVVRAYLGSRLLTEGQRVAGWTGSAVTVPIKPLTRSVAGVRLCFNVGPNGERVFVLGEAAPPAEDMAGQAGPLPGRVAVEELRQGHRSWLSLALTVARHMGLGKALSGSWVAVLVAALMASIGALGFRALLRELS